MAWIFRSGVRDQGLGRTYSNPTQVVKRSRAFRRPYPAKASTPRNNPNRIAIAHREQRDAPAEALLRDESLNEAQMHAVTDLAAWPTESEKLVEAE